MSKIIKCLIVDDEAMARDIIAMHLSKIDHIEVVAQCSNAIEAFNCIRNNAIDLIFLDINMPEISGIAFAKSINKDIKVIFTTAYRDYAVEGFDLQAVDYLLKPISFERLARSINRLTELTQNIKLEPNAPSTITDFIFVRSDRRMLKIDFTDISYVESYSDYIKIHLHDKTIVTRETISAIEAKLPSQQFIRIHRSYIVALNKITSYSNEEVIIENKALTISRSYKTEVLNRLASY